MRSGATRSSVCDGRFGNGRVPRRSNDGSASRGDPRAPRPAHEPRGRVVASSGPRRYPGSRAASTNAPRGCSPLERGASGHLRSRVPPMRSIFLSSRDASPRRATLNAGQLVRDVVTRGDSGKSANQSRDCTQRVSRKKCRAAPRGQKKRFSRGIFGSTFPHFRGFPTTDATCILCGNYPIRPGRPQVSCPPSTRFWKWAHKITHSGARSAALTHDYKSVLRLSQECALVYHREEEEDFVPLPWQVIGAVPQRTRYIHPHSRRIAMDDEFALFAAEISKLDEEAPPSTSGAAAGAGDAPPNQAPPPPAPTVNSRPEGHSQGARARPCGTGGGPP